MMSPICVLTMHHYNEIKNDFSISPKLLKKALQSAIDAGFYFITYAEFKDVLLRGKKPRPKSVLLTFDDGYYDNYKYAFAVLKELNIPAVCFLITDKIRDVKRTKFDIKPHDNIDYERDFEQFLNLDEIKEMVGSGIFEFDSHTASHFLCDSDDEETLKREFSRSKDRISELFADKKDFGFCWPKGRFNELSIELIIQSEYDFAFSVIDGGFYKNDDKFKIRRIDISTSKGSDKNYIFRLKKKLRLYSTPIIGDLYSKFRNRKFV